MVRQRRVGGAPAPPVIPRIACPHPAQLDVGGTRYTADEIVARLMAHLAPARAGRVRRVVMGRSYAVAPVLDGLHDLGNVSAVLRTAEALGCQPVHIIADVPPYKVANRVTQGAEKWLDIERWHRPGACIEALRHRGYRILAAHLSRAQPIDAYAFDVPTAIVFGNEHTGVRPEVLEAADGRVYVPMPGFTRSFNISVAAALCLYHIYRDRCARLGAHGDLTPEERTRLLAVYCVRSMKHAAALLAEADGPELGGR